MTDQTQPTISAQELYEQLAEEKLNHLNAQEKIEILTTQNQHLQNEIALLRKQLYGTSSEKLKKKAKDEKTPDEATEPAADPNIFDEASIEDVVFEENQTSELEEAISGENTDTPSSTDKPKTTRARTPLSKNLPRVRVEHDLEESEKVCCCGCGLSKIGEEISEQLDVVPAYVRVLQHVRFKYACKSCTDGVTTAPMPLQAIPKGIPSSGLLSHVCIAKFDDHLPLYRQSEIWERLRVHIPRSSLSAWIIKVGTLALPLVDLLRGTICDSDYVHADETTTQVLKEKGRSATSKSYMWLYMTGSYTVGEADNHPISVVYDYQETRQSKHPENFLRGFKGYLQTDAYSGYNEVTAQEGVTSVGCWAHARRKFKEVYDQCNQQPGKSEDALKIIAKLYEYEKKFKESNLSAKQVEKLRKEYVAPLLDRFKTWLVALRPKVPPKNPLGKAITYTLNQWESLIVYAQDGMLNIDNNPAERMIRPFTVGRKNWLFIGNPEGARASAAIYSLIETAKANGVHPGEYLAHVFAQIPLTTPKNLHTLLPWNVNIKNSLCQADAPKQDKQLAHAIV
jgi:transposase